MNDWKRNLYAVWFGQILSLMGFGFVLPFLAYYIQELGVTDDTELKFWVGAISSVPAITMGIMAPIWGHLADRFGRKLMVLRSLAGGAVIMFLMSRAGSVHMVFVLRVIQGLIAGSVAASATLVASGTPKEHLSYALGFLSSSTFLGYMLGPVIGGFAAELFGYRTSFTVGSLILTAAFIIVLIMVRDIRAVEENEADAEHNDGSEFVLRDLMKRPFIYILLVMLLLRFTRTLPYPYIPLWIQQVRGTVEGSSAVMGMISAGTGIFAAAAGMTITRLGDRFNKLKLVALYLAAACVLSIPLFFLDGLIPFSAVYIILAFAIGGVEPTIQSYLSGITPAGKRGLLFGVQATVGSIGWFFAPLTGSVISITLGIRYIFLAYSVMLFIVFIVVAYISGIRISRKRT